MPDAQDEIEKLIERIDENPDWLHSDYTPAVDRLIEIGEPALGPAVELLLSERRVTRMRAQRVLEGVTMRMFGFRPGRGWNSPEQSEEWETLWESLGDISYDDPRESREAAVDSWERWLSERSEGDPVDR